MPAHERTMTGPENIRAMGAKVAEAIRHQLGTVALAVGWALVELGRPLLKPPLDAGTAQLPLFEYQEFLPQGEDACDPFDVVETKPRQGSATAAALAAERETPKVLLLAPMSDEVCGNFWVFEEVLE